MEIIPQREPPVLAARCKSKMQKRSFPQSLEAGFFLFFLKVLWQSAVQIVGGASVEGVEGGSTSEGALDGFRLELIVALIRVNLRAFAWCVCVCVIPFHLEHRVLVMNSMWRRSTAG